jgi:hypothetical protein
MKGGLENEKITKEKALTCRGLRQGEELDSTSLRGSESRRHFTPTGVAIKHLQS